LLLPPSGATSHSDQTTLYLTPMHAEAGLIKSMIANVHAAIRFRQNAAEQLPKLDRWATMLELHLASESSVKRPSRSRPRHSPGRGNCRF